MTGTGYAWDFSFLWAYRWLILTGLGITIAYTIGTIITAATYRPLEVYTMVAVIYFLVLFPLTLAAQQIERRLARAD